MDNKELKENIVNIIKGYSNLTTSFGKNVRDFILNEDDFEDVAEEIVNLLHIHDVSDRYTIEDIERCVENWGMCKVEKEYIEKFLNGR